MKFIALLCLVACLLITSCSSPDKPPLNISQRISKLSSIAGKTEFLSSPFVTAGNRVYLIGNQDGSFPDIGWHIDGEMGGIWDHPIKLMDGFTASIRIKGTDNTYCLDKADKFTNYPMANSHEFTWGEEQISIRRAQFVPDSLEGVVIEFVITNKSSSPKTLTFNFSGRIDLRPTWLGERLHITDGNDTLRYDQTSSAVIANDKINSWFTAFGSTLKATSFSDTLLECFSQKRKGLGADGTLSYEITVDKNEEQTIPIYIAGSNQSEEALLKTFALLKTDADRKLSQKINRFENILNASSLTIPDQKLNEIYTWLKYNVDWLRREVPGQGIGLSAGLPDYPWWFGADASYALQGVLATGDHELVKNTILLLHNISSKKNGNGRIIHEVSTNGEVYNAGNVNETPQFISLLLQYYEWTGDKALISQLYSDVKKGMQWLKEQDNNHNGYPDGSGMMEIPGLDTEMIDVAVYTQQGLSSAAALAEIMDDSVSAANYREQAQALKVKINQEWWQDRDRSFGDFRATVAEAKPILDAAIIRSDTLKKTWAVSALRETQKQLKRYGNDKRMAHVVYRNWVVNTPLETGIADKEKGRAALETAKQYENAYGVFVTGLDRTQEPDSVVLKSRKKTFSYAGAVMTLPTGVLAVGAANYGTPEDVLVYLDKLKRSFSYALPGSMYEVSPDFGMMTQAWNIYGVAVPIIKHLFGINPKAYEKKIFIKPNLPAAWNDVSIDNVKVGNNAMSLNLKVSSSQKEYHISQTDGTWTILINTDGAKRITVNDKEVELKTISDGWLGVTGLKNEVVIEK